VTQVEVFQNEYLPEGGRVVDAVLTVTTGDGPAVPRAAKPTVAQVIMIDHSGSMAGANLVAAKKAARAAIDALRGGASFAIVAGDDKAKVLFPPRGLATASPASRIAAKAAISTLRSGGGTNFHTWLAEARQLLQDSGADIRHAILLTDGANYDSAAVFERELRRCAGVFTCDSRGIGSGWVARDLLRIADVLLGTADGIKDGGRLADDFRQMTEAAMGKTMGDVALRVWTPAGSRLRFVKQVYPDLVDLTDRRVDANPRAGDYPTGSWGAESRDYHISVEVEPDGVGEEILAARVSVLHHGEVLGQGLVRAIWTDDTAAATVINNRVAHYNGQAELAEAIQEGLAARAAGDATTATARLGRAVQLASESGRDDTAKVLAGVVEIIDAPSGTVRLRSHNENAEINLDAEIAAVGSRKTHRVRPAE
jgi:hypothetical protein